MKFNSYEEIIEAKHIDAQNDDAQSQSQSQSFKKVKTKVVKDPDEEGKGKKVNAVIEIANNPAKSGRSKRLNYALDEPTDDEVMRDAKGEVDDVAIYNTAIGENKSWLYDKIKDALHGSPAGFFIQGYAGWGKTSIIKQVAKQFGLSIITVYLDKALPEDIGGIPSLDKAHDGTKYVTYAMPSWAALMYNAMEEEPNKKFLLFFDEMNQASGEVQNTLMPIILEKTICGIEFNNFIVGAAGNYSGENEYLNALSEPLQSRFGATFNWRKDWASAQEHLIEKYENEFDVNYSSDGLRGDKNGTEPNVTPIVELTRWPLFKNPRDLENHVILHMLTLQDMALKGVAYSYDRIKRHLIGNVEGAVWRENAPKGEDEYTFQSDNVMSDLDKITALNDICKYFEKYFKHVVEMSDSQGAESELGMGDLYGDDESPVDGLTLDAYDFLKSSLIDGDCSIGGLVTFANETEGFIEGNDGNELSGEIAKQLINHAKTKGWYRDIKNRML